MDCARQGGWTQRESVRDLNNSGAQKPFVEGIPMSKLDERIRQIDTAFQLTGVCIGNSPAEVLSLCGELCLHFGIGYGTLLRRAEAIALADNAGSITQDHLQEAAQHLIIKHP